MNNSFRKALFSFVAVGLVLALTACDSPEQKEAKFLRRGNALYEAGAFDKAALEYKNAARLKPTDAEPLYRIGLVAEQKGDLRNAFIGFSAAEQQDAHYSPAVLKVAQYHIAAESLDEARKRIDSVLADDPQNAEAHALSASILLREQKFDQAEEEAQKALKIASDNVSATSALVGIYSAQKQPEKALAAVNEGLVHNPKNLALMLLRVALYGATDDLSKVAEAYQSIFKLKPNAPEFRSSLAKVFVKANKIDEAESVLRDGMASMPENWDMKHVLVSFLMEHRSAATAEAEIKKLMQEHPNKDDLYFWLADLYVKSNDIENAGTLLNQVIARGQFSPSALNARAILARLSLQSGKRDVADKLIATVLEKQPDNRPALLVRATLAFQDGYYQNAITDLHTIVQNNPSDRNASQLLAETYLIQGHPDLAVDTMKKVVELDLSDNAARVRLAQMMSLNGDIKQARDLTMLVTKTAPDYALGWEAAARIAIDAQEWLPAGEAIRALDKIDGQHLTASFLEGLVLEKSGKKEEALSRYTEVINADPSSPLASHALTSLMGLYSASGRMEDALQYLQGLNADVPLVSLLLGKTYLATGRPSEAAAVFDRLIETKTSLVEPYLERASLYLSAKMKDQAVETLQKGMEVVPADPRLSLVLAGLFIENEKIQEAFTLYDDLLKRNPDNIVAANNLAELVADYEYKDAALLEKAKQVAERFNASTEPFLLDTLAWVYFRQGKVALAQTIIDRAFSQKKPMPPQAHYHYGMILLGNGQKDKAKEEFGKAVVEGANYPGLDEAKRYEKDL